MQKRCVVLLADVTARKLPELTEYGSATDEPGEKPK